MPTFLLKDSRAYPLGKYRYTYEVKTEVPLTVEAIKEAFKEKAMSMYGSFNGELLIYPNDDGKTMLEWCYYAAI